jgi:cytochrome c oxidase cbb3-type subunit 3
MKRWPVPLACLSIASSLLLAGCGRLPGQPSPADIELKPENVRDFAALYNLNCAGCHGENGKGNAALALNNPVYLTIASDASLRQATSLGVPGTMMPAFLKSAGGTLTKEQIDILVSEMRSRWSKAMESSGAMPPPYATHSGGDTGRGAKAYAVYCAACHGADGKGSATGSDILDNAYLALVSDQALRSTIIAGRPDLRHPDWHSYIPGQPMADQEVTDLVAWLGAKRVDTPGQPYPKSH